MDFTQWNTKNSNRCVINIDWLQLHVINKVYFSETTTVRYKITRTGQTKTFRNVYSITDFYNFWKYSKKWKTFDELVDKKLITNDLRN